MPGRYPSPLKLSDYYLGKNIRPNFKELNNNDYNELFEDYKNLKKYNNELKKYSLYPLLLFAFIFIISISSLLFIDTFTAYPRFGRTYATSLICISAASIIELIIYILNVIYRAVDLDKENIS